MPKLIHLTKCLLCDPKKAFTLQEEEFEANAAVLAGQVEQRLAQFNVRLLQHIQKGAEFEQKQLTRMMKDFHEHNGPEPDTSGAKHLRAWELFIAMTALAQGSAILRHFQTADPGLNAMQEMGRSKLHELTRRIFFTDEMIQDAVVRLNLDLPDQDNVLGFAKLMRDALCEQGNYAPKLEQAPQVMLT